MEKTKIQWCDSTVNFWHGCTKVSAGCANCYAENLDARFHAKSSHWGAGVKREPHLDSATKLALRLHKKPWVCESCGRGSDRHYDHSCTGRKEDACHTNNVKWHRRRVFCGSMMDWLDDEVPIEWLVALLHAIYQTPGMDWLLLTKRPQNFLTRMNVAAMALLPNMLFAEWLFRWGRQTEGTNLRPPSNVWLGTSVENQEQEERIVDLLCIPAAKRFLSIEPMLEEMDITSALGENHGCGGESAKEGCEVCGHLAKPFDWIIVGGESGPNARPCNVDWIRGIVEQCKSAKLPVFVKQLGGNPRDGINWKLAGPDKLLLKDSHGGDPSEWPEDIRIREYPL